MPPRWPGAVPDGIAGHLGGGHAAATTSSSGWIGVGFCGVGLCGPPLPLPPSGLWALEAVCPPSAPSLAAGRSDR